MGERLGQHFLTGKWAAAKLAEAAGIGNGDDVLEIGPGTGALTKELLARGGRVVAIEKDEALVENLKQTFAGYIATERLRIISADIRDIDPESIGLYAGNYILAANIPYYITGEIVRQFLTTAGQPKTMALLMQKEVAERIRARDGKESILSISVKAYGTPSIAAKVSRGNFSPPPSVDSAILVINNISKRAFADFDENHFFKIVRTGFSSKRKMLAGNLLAVADKETIATAFKTCGIESRARAEDVATEIWLQLASLLQ